LDFYLDSLSAFLYVYKVRNSRKAWPTESTKVTSEYGNRIHPITKKEKFHSGIDIAPIKSGVEGEDIFAATNGIVVKTGYQFDSKSKTGLENYIIIESNVNNEKVRTVYAHLKDNSITVEEGDEIDAGKKIANMGKTGGATGVHLHFEIRVYDYKNNKWYTTNPKSYKYNYK
jgi:murein DD-endopeptidase MepM/ murein hydrolase activator NlpD